MAVALEIKGLSYVYKSNWLGRGFLALKDLSLEVAEGESFAFLGHNGAGKTTAIKCVLGLTKPSKGLVRILGCDGRRTASRRQVGYLPEQPYFYDHLTVVEILNMYASLAGVAVKDRSRAVDRALSLVKLTPRRTSPLRALSKGLTQRVAMAQALIASPRLLILDEPFSGLDPIGRKEFRDLLSSLKKEGVTIFISSHILGDIECLCDRAAILSQGELKGVFSLKELNLATPSCYELLIESHPEVTVLSVPFDYQVTQEDDHLKLTVTKREQAESLLRAVLDNNLKVLSFHQVRGNLEDLFVQLVNFDEAKGL